MKLVLAAALLAACGSMAGSNISETHMVQVPPRPSNCLLKLVSVDITSPMFNQTWEVIGYVTLLDSAAQDPSTPANRTLVRPRACAMGGTAVAVALNAASQGGSGLVYMVLHPKPPPATGTVTF